MSLSAQQNRQIAALIRKRVPLTSAEAKLVCVPFKSTVVKKGSFIKQSGDRMSTLLLVTSGMLRSYSLDSKGNDTTFQFAKTNHWTGDPYSLFTNEATGIEIEALEDSEVVHITIEELDTLYEQVPILERYFRLMYQDAYIFSMRRIHQALQDKANVRYENLLKSYPDLFAKTSLANIASYLGITPESLSRIRKSKA